MNHIHKSELYTVNYEADDYIKNLINGKSVR